MNLDYLHYFEVLAKIQHYGKAAEKLNISQPNLTYAISQIEQELNVPLFKKKGRGITLTRYGQEFLNTVENSLDILDSGTRIIKEASQNGGFIQIGSIRTLGKTLVPKLMNDFKKETKTNIKFQLHSETGFSSSLFKAVEEERLDFCFTSYKADSSIFENITFKSSPYVVIVPKNHPLTNKEEINLEETIPYPQIYFAKCAGLRKNIDELFSHINKMPNIVMETEEDEVVAGLVANGFGIAIIPDDPLFKSLPLKVLKLTNPDSTRKAYMSRLRKTKLPKTAEDFWQFCKSRL